ncbi:MAG: hypothetical protein H6809_01190 [Phycisphaeraceae bacterium]|nr:hypothetical protein [Phycisphaeraceae bacterium]
MLCFRVPQTDSNRPQPAGGARADAGRCFGGFSRCVTTFAHLAIFAAFALLLLTPRAALGARPGQPDLRLLPPDIDGAICISDAAIASRQTSGGAGRRMGDDLARLLGLPAAWDELWRTLDLPADEAIDRLLGQRVVIAWRSLADDPDAPQRIDEEPDWIVLSLVDGRTERLIRERLRPAPRDVEAGQAILSLEDGRYLLTTRLLGRGGSPEQQRRAIIMLAPSAHMELFKRMLPRLGERIDGATLGDEPAVRESAALLERDIAMVTRGSTPDGVAVGVVGASWRRGERLAEAGPGLDATVVRTGPGVPHVGGAGGQTLSLAQVERLAGGAPLAISEWLSEGVWGGGNGADGDGDAAARPTEVAGAGERSARVGVGLGPTGSLAAMLAPLAHSIGLSGGGRALLGREAFVVVQGAGRATDPVVITIGARTSDIGGLAVHGDAVMAAVLTPVEADPATGRLEPSGELAGPNYLGAYPPAARVALVPSQSGASLNGLLGPSTVLAWQFEPAAPLVKAQEGQRPWGVPGWWISRLGATPAGASAENAAAAQLRRVADVLGENREGLATPNGAAPVVSAGVARPAQLLGTLAAVGAPVPPAMGAVRWISAFRWEGRLVAPGRVEMQIGIDLDPAMGPPRE